MLEEDCCTTEELLYSTGVSSTIFPENFAIGAIDLAIVIGCFMLILAIFVFMLYFIFTKGGSCSNSCSEKQLQWDETSVTGSTSAVEDANRVWVNDTRAYVDMGLDFQLYEPQNFMSSDDSFPASMGQEHRRHCDCQKPEPPPPYEAVFECSSQLDDCSMKPGNRSPTHPPPPYETLSVVSSLRSE